MLAPDNGPPHPFLLVHRSVATLEVRVGGLSDISDEGDQCCFRHPNQTIRHKESSLHDVGPVVSISKTTHISKMVPHLRMIGLMLDHGNMCWVWRIWRITRIIATTGCTTTSVASISTGITSISSARASPVA